MVHSSRKVEFAFVSYSLCFGMISDKRNSGWGVRHKGPCDAVLEPDKSDGSLSVAGFLACSPVVNGSLL